VGKKKRETVGASSLRLSRKAPDAQNAIDQMRESLTDYDQNIHMCVSEHRNVFPGNFFVVVITKKERLMSNVVRGYFTARLSCPTPDYDQAVYRYTREDDRLEFLWVVPARDMCMLLRSNSLAVPPEQYELLGYILKFEDGTLMDTAKKLNGEKIDSIFTE